jgi:metallo-beta-lactamase family protein
MFQGSEFIDIRNSLPFPFDVAGLTAVVITHAHLDHVGRLPLLIKAGYTGYIYATPATIELLELILRDAWEIMRYNHEKFGSPILYDVSDIAAVVDQCKPVTYYEERSLTGDDQLKIKLYDSGHIFGAACVEVFFEGKRLMFSGDVGNVNVPILRDTDPLPSGLDVLVCESTYGGRMHESVEARRVLIARLVRQALQRGGVLMIPTFSLERTQELLYDLKELVEHEHNLPKIPIFLDSPLAIDALRVYRKYPAYYDAEALQFTRQGEDIFSFEGLVLTRTREESKRINQVLGPKVVIAGAGMMNGGRILHHALRYLSDERSTLLIIGYQAAGTLGRSILEGQSPVKLLGETVQVRCRVQAVGAFSAHADQQKLVAWISVASQPPRRVFVNHGEPESSLALALKLKDVGIMAEVAEPLTDIILP